MDWTIHDYNGHRKYLTIEETKQFLAQAARCDPLVHSFCCFLVRTGCRISEALSLTAENIDFAAQQVIIKCLKKRQKQVFRAVPLPRIFLDKLRGWFRTGVLPTQGLLWPWSRMTGYRRVREVMARARIVGEHASPKGLRHGFGVRAIQSNVPLNLVQRWLGHADIKTTAIYTSVIGPEERAISARMWKPSAEAASANGL
ncbi:tyrosine-type recombinase/integrase [Sphingomonas nostoxanthinifaciens]|uniref:tyrosine-type recombinase/integrase n=1 Tax=Sphingomonas nostoxanthinifaciens TaxID=2872652 RepID=UPI001CC20908|nr:site-specific integrase [Sphingomonas nostoxanthinifaciens]UAK22998.1 site-specific integrase [Sphingomonas nostoxanthinifaciens]